MAIHRLPQAVLIGLFVVLAATYARWVANPPATAPAHSPVLLAQDGVVVNYQDHVRPVLATYCYGCHGEKRKGGLDLRRFADAADVKRDRQLFEKVLKNLQFEVMPPESKPQPTPAQRQLVASWIESQLFYCDCSQPDPGRVTLRRLNRTEYNNTIQDLVGVDFHPADDFPADDVGYGFDNIGDVLSMPPVLLERYLAAAERILDAAIVTGPLPPPVKRFAGRELEGGTLTPEGGRVLASEGEVGVEFPFPAAGEYHLRVRAFGDQAGPEPARMSLRLGGQEVQALEVAAKRVRPETYEAKLRVEAGRKRVAAAFLNDYYQPQDPNPANRDRNLHLLHLEITGPVDSRMPPLPESHRRIFFCQPDGPREAALQSCARRILGEFARRAYRRPVTLAEVDRLMRFFELARGDGANFEASVKLALQAVLVSPHFLFRGELQPEPDNPRSVHPVNEFALASRLSYFLWSSMPDEELFRLAEQGTLRKHLADQVKRMLGSPRAQALVDGFASQWLQVRNLDLVAPDPKEFPNFDADLRAAMRRETELFFAAIMREDRSVLDFLEADFTFVNQRLARHYGLADIRGDDFQRVSLRGTPRGGLLTQASILTITSNPTRTSPVKRGKWVLENILGTPPPPPPPDVPELPEAKGEKLVGTLRERMEQHRSNPMCSSCHARMDPIGFGFENFDGVGAWRERDGDRPIDPAGQLVSGESFHGPAGLRAILLNRKKDEFVRCLSTKMLTYALGRGLEYYDRCALDQITQQLAKNHYRFSTLVLEIVKSAPFQLRRGEVPLLAGK
jgi:hypothetical protein